MNEWHVLVTYALDVVFTKSVVKQSWTFHWFHRHDSGAVSVLEVVPAPRVPAEPVAAIKPASRALGERHLRTERFCRVHYP
ncbi:MAG: hypothetical protein Ct9H300mP14_07340 [Gammaproteobacteria bacterium]|nr:MAG: hypothetical protein Ct9H300mP14_07340 [Gammaproteobacteria bacterium]